MFLSLKELKNNFSEILISNKCGVIYNEAEEDTRSEDRGVSPDKVKRGAGVAAGPIPQHLTQSRAALQLAASFNQDLHPSGGFKVMGQVWGQAWVRHSLEISRQTYRDRTAPAPSQEPCVWARVHGQGQAVPKVESSWKHCLNRHWQLRVEFKSFSWGGRPW